MRQQQFEQTYQEEWQQFQALLNHDEKSGIFSKFKNKENKKNVADTGYDFINLYRLTCQHYALAKQRHYSPQLVGYLHGLVLQGHQQLYKRQTRMWSRVFEFFAYTFPVRFREHIALFWLALLAFLVPLLAMGLACYMNEDMLYSVMSNAQVSNMESMYNPSNHNIGRESGRTSDTDMVMFGHYIQNNISIDFRIYAMGIFAGIGTMLSLIFNGVIIGGVSGHLTGIGFGETFWQFVVGHGSFELTAAVISGAAGLRLAQALFMPGNYTRSETFKIAGRESIELLLGAATMTFIAAFIEAFWSSSSVIPIPVKYVVGLALWFLVIGYLAFAGKQKNKQLTSVYDGHVYDAQGAGQ